LTTEQWYVLDQATSPSVTRGPYGADQLAGLATSGLLRSDTLVARVGADAWVPASEEPELRKLFATSPPPAPAVRLSPPSHPTVEAIWSPDGAPAGMPFSFGNCFRLGWSALTRHYGVLVVCGLLWIAMSSPFWLVDMIAEFMKSQGKAQGDSALMSQGSMVDALGGLLGFIFGPAIGMALLWPGVTAIRGQAKVSDAFVGFKRFWGLLLNAFFGVMLVLFGSLAFGLVFGLLTGLSSAIGGRGAGLQVWLGIPLLIVGLVLLLRLVVAVTLSYVLLCDPLVDIKAGSESIAAGWKSVNLQRGTPVAVVVFGFILSFMTVFLFCLGWVLLGAPLLMGVIAATYELLRVNGHLDIRQRA
jgi:hypothetical protein